MPTNWLDIDAGSVPNDRPIGTTGPASPLINDVGQAAFRAQQAAEVGLNRRCDALPETMMFEEIAAPPAMMLP